VQPPATSAVAALFARDPADSSVLVVDGYGVHLHVRHGQLVVDDGIELLTSYPSDIESLTLPG